MYSFIVLFFTLPLYFSHVFSPLGLIIGEVSSFERQKVYLFVVLVLIACFEGFIRFRDPIWNTIKRYGHLFFIVALIPLFSLIYFGNSLGIDFLIGSHEKNHGYILYFASIVFFLLLLSASREHLKKYISWSIVSAVLVACIAIGEQMGGMPDIYGRFDMMSLYPGRSSSTLGNPNYVAGYLLPFIPILISYIRKQRHILKLFSLICSLIIIVTGVNMTGSYIALLLIGILAIWCNITLVFRGYSFSKQIYLFIMVTVLLIFLGFSLVDPAKLLSFESRFILMRESIVAMFHYPISLIFGFGPDSLLSYFSQVRSPLVSQYFPDSMLIDSSHNILIDILFQYGIIPIFLFISFLYSKRSYLPTPIGISCMLLSIFLIFNVFVVSHIIMLFLFMVYLLKNKKESF